MFGVIKRTITTEMKKKETIQERQKSNSESTNNTDSIDIQEKLENVEVKSSLSPTSLLAKSTVLLPSGVVRVKQMTQTKPSSSSMSSGSATGNPRNKTALAPGHSLMDWIRLGNSGVDLTGVGGVPRVVTLSELASHNKQNDAWIAIRGIVFNVTRYMDFHPGGIDELMRGVGKDATKLFDSVHAWVNYQSILQKCVVGRLSRSSNCSISSSSVPETPATKASCLSTLSLIKSCTAQNTDEPKNSDSDVWNIKLDWRQTTNSITLFYKPILKYPAIYYQLHRITDSKLVFKLFLDKDVVTHELDLAADVEWPPVCQRNFDTMQFDFIFRKKSPALWKTQGSHTLLKEQNENKRVYKRYEVLTNTPLSKLVNLLVLRAEDSLQLVPIGRHLEAKLNVQGMEASRSYTPVPPGLHPDDIVPNYKCDCICLMVKRYPDGALSPSIVELQPGQTIILSNALGSFAVEAFSDYSSIHMLAGGTGLTVMLGIIQWALARRNVKRINLVNFNKDEDNMFYGPQLERATNSEKLTVTHVLSKAADTWSGRRGPVSDSLLKELIGNSNPESCVFTCGPLGFIQAARKCLDTLKWKSTQIYEFDD